MEQQRSKLSPAIAVGLAIALGWPFLFFGQGPESLANVRQDVGVIVKEWAVTLIVLSIVFFWERRPLSSLGLRMPTWKDLGAMVLIFVATMLAAGTAAAFTEQHAQLANPAALLSVPFLVRLAIVLTAGICEETISRGFAAQRLSELIGNPWLAGVIVVLAFGLAHIPRYGLNPSLLVPTVTGAMLTLLYLWRRNLTICIILHTAIDAISLLLGPMTVQHP